MPSYMQACVSHALIVFSKTLHYTHDILKKKIKEA